RDPAQLHPPDELVAGLEEDSEVGEILRLAEPREPALLGLQREERVRPDRLPAIEEDPVAHEHLEQSLGVVDLQLAEVDRYFALVPGRTRRTARRNGAATAAPTKAARLRMFVVVQVRHALQHAGAISA